MNMDLCGDVSIVAAPLSEYVLLKTLSQPQLLRSKCSRFMMTNVFLQKMLVYEPSTRISAKQATKHRYFEDVQLNVPPKLVVLPMKVKPLQNQ